MRKNINKTNAPKNDDFYNYLESYIKTKMKNKNFVLKITLQLYADKTIMKENILIDADKSFNKISKEHIDIHKYCYKKIKKRTAKINPQI